MAINPDCRAIVLSAAGKHFCAGIDLSSMMSLGQQMGDTEDVARKGIVLERTIKLYQDSISAVERCPKPVIMAVHQACIGAGVDLITAGDIRYSTQDAFFQVKEVEIGMAADVGTLQRLPKVIGSQSLVRELCYTGRRFEAVEAERSGLISRVYSDKDALVSGALAVAEDIASKSPIAVQTTKESLVYSLEHTNQEGLDHIVSTTASYLHTSMCINIYCIICPTCSALSTSCISSRRTLPRRWPHSSPRMRSPCLPSSKLICFKLKTGFIFNTTLYYVYISIHIKSFFNL